MRLCVIPARGGSKRIPRKNIKEFFGKPIVAWSIAAALESDCFDKVMVSTDDEEIAEVCRQYGAEVPFSRPLELADDKAATGPVIYHAIEWYKKNNWVPEFVCCLYPAAPFVTAESLRAGLAELLRTETDFVFPVVTFTYPIQRAIRIHSTGSIEMFQPEKITTRSQDLEKAYHDAGQYYWGKTSAWLERKSTFNSKSAVIIIPRYRAQDIDTLEDWKQAELMFKVLTNLNDVNDKHYSG